LALFVELSIVREICLRHDAQQPATIDYKGAVEELPLKAQRSPDEQHGTKLIAFLDDPGKRVPCRIKQDVLMEQVLVRIGGYSKFGEERHSRAQVRSMSCQAECVFGVKVWIGNAHVRDAYRRTGKAVCVYRMKGKPLHHMDHKP
jgi:hypothetical protein